MLFQFKVLDQQEQQVSLEAYRGKVLLIVNTATHCGFTKQYKDLVALYEKYHCRGLEILDFPCNQFGEQAPENDHEITTFCQAHYGTPFKQFKKIDVNGPNASPLFDYLKQQKPFVGFGKGFKAKLMVRFTKKNQTNQNDIRWNFTKFVIDKEGEVVARFEPTHNLLDLECLIVRLCEGRCDKCH